MVAVLLVLLRLYAVLAAGWVAARLLERGGAAPERLAAPLTRVVTDLTMPALIVTTLVSRPLDPAMLGAVGAALVGLGAALLAALALAPRVAPEPRRRGAFLLAATFCNTGFLGIPVAEALWGPGSAGLSTAMLVDAFTTTLLLNTVGVVLALRHGSGAPFDRAALVALVRTPMFLAVPVGLALQLGEVALPGRLAAGLAALGAPTAWLVFLATGLRLRFSAVHRYLPALGAVVGVRFLVSPAAAWAVARILGLDGEVATQAVLEVAMPTALMAPVVAARYGCDPELGPAAVAATTAAAAPSVLAWWWITGGGA